MCILNEIEDDEFNYIMRVFYIHTKNNDKSFNSELKKVYNKLKNDSFKKVINVLDNSGYLLNLITVEFPVHEDFETNTDGILSLSGIKYVEEELGLKL